MKALPWLLLAACNGTVGTLKLELTTAPGSTLLDSAQTLQLTITNPHQVTTATRGPSGFTIDLQMPATTAPGSIIVEALDASGTRIAAGESPPLPFGAIDATIVVYMAVPNTIGVAPASLTPARSDVGVGKLTYGAVLAGGLDASGAPTDAIAIYNAFDHSLTGGLALPAARSGVAVGVGALNQVYLFGGRDASGNPTGTLWRFDTNATPNGLYVDLGNKAGFARADAALVTLGNDRFVLTGTPAATLSGLDGAMMAFTDITGLPAQGASILDTSGTVTSVFAGDSGVVRRRSNAFEMIDTTPHPGAVVVALPTGKLAVLCGSGPAELVDPTASGTTPVSIAAPAGCAAAVTQRHLVIAGDANAQIFDATTLAPIAQPPLVVPRNNASAIALPNGQVLIAGGTDGSGAPIATLELFTPEPQ
ncbi:MAG: hypothetical protein JO257_34380 [Deltaproteobacteria bacterium]|nr:hypothetical protein [Deltaproteobacteria bacterium]